MTERINAGGHINPEDFINADAVIAHLQEIAVGYPEEKPAVLNYQTCRNHILSLIEMVTNCFKPVKVFISVEKGMVSAVHTDSQSVEVEIQDCDELEQNSPSEAAAIALEFEQKTHGASMVQVYTR